MKSLSFAVPAFRCRFLFLGGFLLFGVVFPMFVLQEKKNQMNDLHPGVEFTDVVLEEGGFERQRIPEIFFFLHQCDTFQTQYFGCSCEKKIPTAALKGASHH